MNLNGNQGNVFETTAMNRRHTQVDNISLLRYSQQTVNKPGGCSTLQMLMLLCEVPFLRPMSTWVNASWAPVGRPGDRGAYGAEVLVHNRGRLKYESAFLESLRLMAGGRDACGCVSNVQCPCFVGFQCMDAEKEGVLPYVSLESSARMVWSRYPRVGVEVSEENSSEKEDEHPDRHNVFLVCFS